VLILDEPANGLDPAGVRWLRSLIRDLASGGTTVLVSSHILAEVAQIADSVIIMDRGRLVVQAPVAELTSTTTGLEDVFLSLTSQPGNLENPEAQR
jgi:ABC-2 type transport system ATP-binding protein